MVSLLLGRNVGSNLERAVQTLVFSCTFLVYCSLYLGLIVALIMYSYMYTQDTLVYKCTRLLATLLGILFSAKKDLLSPTQTRLRNPVNFASRQVIHYGISEH